MKSQEGKLERISEATARSGKQNIETARQDSERFTNVAMMNARRQNDLEADIAEWTLWACRLLHELEIDTESGVPSDYRRWLERHIMKR